MITNEDRCLAVMEYERVLTGEKTALTIRDRDTSEQEALDSIGAIWRYAVIHILRWTYAYARDNFSNAEYKFLKLDRTIDSSMPIAKEIANARSYLPALALAFPEKVNMSERRRAIEIYTSTMKARERGCQVKYPHGFFSQDAGLRHATDIFMYCISDILLEMKPSELYEFFGSNEGRKWIIEMGLELPCSVIFHGDPVEYLYASVPARYKDDRLLEKYEKKDKKDSL